ncbi:hypothetical protein CCR80_08420 [Rhodothalassium salexigens]|nr:hypothetical protein [Rhodothalassium salexigens]
MRGPFGRSGSEPPASEGAPESPADGPAERLSRDRTRDLAGGLVAGVWVEPALFNIGECARLSALIDAAARDRPAAGGDLAGRVHDPRVRACETLWLDDEPATAWAFERLAHLVAGANAAAFGFDLDADPFIEGALIARYPGTMGGHYDWHVDRARRGPAARRKLSVSVQLSPPGAYDGGALTLNAEGHEVTLDRALGTAAVFPSFVLHRVAPVTRGARVALVAWAHGPRLR